MTLVLITAGQCRKKSKRELTEMKPIRVVLIKPSQYDYNNYVARYRYGLMPNSTLSHVGGLTPENLDGHPVEIHMIDEYVEPDLKYLNLLKHDPSCHTLVALVGVMSIQYQRALDLCAFALKNGVRNVVVGGSHVMTCDTFEQQNRGVSFALAEAELIWDEILSDTISGQLKPVYGLKKRWIETLPSTVIRPQTKKRLSRYAVRMQGIYPSRGCPFRCNYCSIIKIAGRKIRSQPLQSTIDSLKLAKLAGAKLIMFTSDNFNKIPHRKEMLRAMIDEKINLPFVVQCDVQISKQEDLFELLGRAGCVQMFVGVESFKRETLVAADKNQNHPEHYTELVRLCNKYKIASHFSNIIGFEQDNEDDIHEHLKQLLDMDPDMASFYILVPIPGTDQYDDFLSRDLIIENNLDFMSSHSLTWRHPNLSPERARELLFHCYHSFYSARRFPSTLKRALIKTKGRPKAAKTVVPANWMVSKYSSTRKVHPMAGGLFVRHFDKRSDYEDLRREFFDVDLVPFPRSLPAPSSTEPLLYHMKN